MPREMQAFASLQTAKRIPAPVHTAERKRKAFVLLFNNVLVMISDWLVVFAESEVRWEWSFTFREFPHGVVTL
jgi:hypothetical protein